VITPRTRVLLVSHPWGQPAELDALYGAASEAGLEVVEDASAALGASFEQSRIGRSPCAAVFRMPLAPLSPGAAPALLALPEELGARLRTRLQGERIGNGVAALATARLEGWDAELSARRQVAACYSSELSRYDAFLVPSTPEGRLPSYSSYVLRLTRFSRTSANDLHKLMAESGIETRMIQLGVEAAALAELAVADRVHSDALLLPCHAQLDAAAIDSVLDALFGYAIG
jgi:dTDP-4-amino-4,6-dideoxygalactose transaminase